MNNDGSGCAWAMLLSLVLVVVIGVSVSMTGLPTWNSGALGWNTTATYERQLTERDRIAEQGRTDRTRIAADERTSTEWAVTLRWLGVSAAAGVGVWAWSRRPHRPQPAPQPVTMLLANYPGHVAELIDGEWCVVDPNTGLYYTEADARHILIANGLGE